MIMMRKPGRRWVLVSSSRRLRGFEKDATGTTRGFSLHVSLPELYSGKYTYSG
jgi:hypothetical protein